MIIEVVRSNGCFILSSYAITSDILAITTNPDCGNAETTDHQVHDHIGREMMSDSGGREESRNGTEVKLTRRAV